MAYEKPNRNPDFIVRIIYKERKATVHGCWKLQGFIAACKRNNDDYVDHQIIKYDDMTSEEKIHFDKKFPNYHSRGI